MDAVVLHFVKEMHAKGMSVTRRAMQVASTETVKLFGRGKF